MGRKCNTPAGFHIFLPEDGPASKPLNTKECRALAERRRDPNFNCLYSLYLWMWDALPAFVRSRGVPIDWIRIAGPGSLYVRFHTDYFAVRRSGEENVTFMSWDECTQFVLGYKSDFADKFPEISTMEMSFKAGFSGLMLGVESCKRGRYSQAFRLAGHSTKGRKFMVMLVKSLVIALASAACSKVFGWLAGCFLAAALASLSVWSFSQNKD